MKKKTTKMRGMRLSEATYKGVVQAAKARDFASPSAFMRAAVEKELRGADSTLSESEQRIGASLEKYSKQVRRVSTGQQALFAYVDAFLEQVLVSVACNGAHNLKQRLARWLLMMRDRGDDDVLQITQNLLAEMLGVQRPTITKAAHELERAGLIARGRRQVTIIDRQGLMAASCECYRLVRMRVAVHLPKTYT